MAGFSMPGLGSGLDVTAMLAEIKRAEQQKLVPYTTKKTSYTNQISSWGKISSSLSELQSNLRKIDEGSFKGVSIGTNKAFKATATTGALPDSYSVVVKQLAKAHKIGTADQQSKTEQLGDESISSRKLRITVGEGKTMDIDLAEDETSLEQMAKKINSQKGDVTAKVQAGEDGNFKLVLSSKKTGDDGALKVEVLGDDKLAEVMDFDPTGTPEAGMSVIAKAQNAIVVVDGSEIIRSGNTITDAIDGITLELQQVSEKDKESGEFKDETLSITTDNSKFQSAVEDFVKLYNTFISESDAASKWYAPDDNGEQNSMNGALMGNGTLRRLTSDMRVDVVGTHNGLSDLYSSLADIGIEVKVEDAATGKLTIDSKKLEAAIQEHPDDIEALFLGKGGSKGISDKLQDLIKVYIGDDDAIPKVKGVIEQTTKGLEEQSKQVSDRIKQIEKMIDVTLERNKQEFDRLDLAMKKMTDTSNTLVSLLGSLS